MQIARNVCQKQRQRQRHKARRTNSVLQLVQLSARTHSIACGPVVHVHMPTFPLSMPAPFHSWAMTNARPHLALSQRHLPVECLECLSTPVMGSKYPSRAALFGVVPAWDRVAAVTTASLLLSLLIYWIKSMQALASHSQ